MIAQICGIVGKIFSLDFTRMTKTSVVIRGNGRDLSNSKDNQPPDFDDFAACNPSVLTDYFSGANFRVSGQRRTVIHAHDLTGLTTMGSVLSWLTLEKFILSISLPNSHRSGERSILGGRFLVLSCVKASVVSSIKPSKSTREMQFSNPIRLEPFMSVE